MFKNYKGAIHIHSTLSDGTGNLKDIVKSAKSAGLDFIIITDHNHYDTEEGIFDGIYVIKGEEISPQNCNHYLALGINEEILPEDNPQIYVDKVHTQGGFGFAAHPNEGFNENGEERKNSHRCIPWTDKNIKPDGVEIWNWFSNWADNLDDRNIFKLAYCYLFKHCITTNPSKLTLEWWDKLNNETENVVPAIGGVDAHALKFYKYIYPVTVFSYKTCFNTVTNVIYLEEKLSEDFLIAKKQILNAIRAGNNTILNRHTLNFIPQICIKNVDKIYYCGQKTELSKDLCIKINSKKTLEILLVYNGKEVEKYKGRFFNIPIEKAGKYRIEASYKGKKFLYTNPFLIQG